MLIFQEQRFRAKIQAGDHTAFDALFERHAPQVLGFLMNLTGSRAEAEDLVQDVFLAAYHAHASFQGCVKPVSWLLGIAVRRWRDCGRRGRLEVIALDDQAEGGKFECGFLVQVALDDQVLDALTLSQALSRLAPAFREALLLVASQGFTYREAADILEEPVGTVKWRVSEASRRMRALLNEGEEETSELQPSK
ncbi:MAG: RNA polymerase sigma factor [Armatimonadota bacterium]|nr:RNA polymerase sigma factor [Armatimonadota bacterium]